MGRRDYAHLHRRGRGGGCGQDLAHEAFGGSDGDGPTGDDHMARCVDRRQDERRATPRKAYPAAWANFQEPHSHESMTDHLAVWIRLVAVVLDLLALVLELRRP
jgi:hypothetical protein